MQWAMQQAVRPATHKFVLVALANYAGPDGLAWPTVAEISDVTGLDRKTVLSALDSLDVRGFAKDSGDRKGRTGQVKVFRLALETVPMAGLLKKDPGIPKDPISPSEESQFSLETVPKIPSNGPKNGTRNQSGTNQEPVKEPVKARVQPPAWLPAEAWSEWLQHRGSKYTVLAQRKTLKQIERFRADGMDPVELIDLAIANGWRGIYPRPTGRRMNPASPPPMNANARTAAGFGTSRHHTEDAIDVVATERKVAPARLG